VCVCVCVCVLCSAAACCLCYMSSGTTCALVCFEVHGTKVSDARLGTATGSLLPHEHLQAAKQTINLGSAPHANARAGASCWSWQLAAAAPADSEGQPSSSTLCQVCLRCCNHSPAGSFKTPTSCTIIGLAQPSSLLLQSQHNHVRICSKCARDRTHMMMQVH
jgi:hypothetical protein